MNSTIGQRLDRLAFDGAAHDPQAAWDLLGPALDVVSVAFVVLSVLAVAFIALGRRRWMLAGQVVVMMGGANLTTQLLKDVIYSRPALLPGWTGGN
ncbi:MAG: phosphoesterase PA-phosphatase, partial [Promicromonosporaceae bacterium]|nr:phosphoesterase PA-phosphatase [Promicromonosporaceae bacterium]